MVELLIPAIAKNGRIIATSSVAYKWASCAAGGLNYAARNPPKTDYGDWGIYAYAESKLALIIWTRMCAKKYRELNFVTVHPGVCNTNLLAGSAVWSGVLALCTAIGLVKTPTQGAAAILDVITAPSVTR